MHCRNLHNNPSTCVTHHDAFQRVLAKAVILTANKPVYFLSVVVHESEQYRYYRYLESVPHTSRSESHEKGATLGVEKVQVSFGGTRIYASWNMYAQSLLSARHTFQPRLEQIVNQSIAVDKQCDSVAYILQTCVLGKSESFQYFSTTTVLCDCWQHSVWLIMQKIHWENAFFLPSSSFFSEIVRKDGMFLHRYVQVYFVQFWWLWMRPLHSPARMHWRKSQKK